MLSASNYMERVCDLILKIGIFMVRRKQEKAYFPPDLRRSLTEYMQLVQAAMDLMLQGIAKDPSQIDLKAVHERENAIDERFELLKKSYLRDMERKRLKVQSGLYYHDLINELERLGDHIENVSEALAGAKG
jgi:phosphate:Na+ symporter